MYAGRRVSLLLVALISSIQVSLGQNCNGQQNTAWKIVQSAKRITSVIEQFKDEFVQDVLSVDWATADANLPPGSLDDPCLPPPPPPSGSYVLEEDFGGELVRMYSFMQGYSTALNHLTLDQLFLDGKQITNVQDIIDNAEHLMNLLYAGIYCHDRTPDNEETEKIMGKIYTDVGAGRRNRDFVILRDTLDAMKYCMEVFSAFT